MSRCPLGRAYGLTFLLALACVPIHGQTAYLVRDLDDDTVSQGSSGPRQFLPALGKLFFTAAASPLDRQMWVSDGTASGTELLAEIREGECSPPNGPQPLGSARSVVFWAAREDEGCFVSQLWRSDGTRAGTFPLTVPELSLFRNVGEKELSFTFLGDVLYFIARLQGEDQIWKSDGTLAGTRLVLGDPSRLDAVRELTAAAGTLFFVADTGVPALWKSNGTAAGTVPLREFPAEGGPYLLTAAGNRLFFLAQGQNGAELWVSDGTAAGTRAVTQFTGFSPFEKTASLVPLGKRIGFVADDGLHGMELWVSDGTAAGTVRLTDFATGSPFSEDFGPGQAAELNGRIVFYATDGQTGIKLWSTAGSPTATIPLLAIGGPLSSLVKAGSRILFAAQDKAHGREPWSTDGTPRGTALLRDVCPGSCDSLLDTDFVPLASGVFFAARATPGGNAELWRTNGTAAGTRAFTSLGFNGRLPGSALQLAELGGSLFFNGEDNRGEELWISDGKAGGTRQVADIQRDVAGGAPQELRALPDRVVFSACRHDSLDVWQSAGTAESTQAVTSGIASCQGASPGPRGLALNGGAVFYWRGEFPQQLWKADLAGGAPLQLTSFSSDAPGSEPPPLLTLGGRLYFQATLEDEAGIHSEIWQSDGSVAGTHKAFDLPADAGRNRFLSVAASRLYFAVYPEGGEPHQLWTSDGTAGGTRLLGSGPLGLSSPPQFTTVGSQVFFLSNKDNGLELWTTDGFAAGTRLVRAIEPFFDGSGPLPELIEHLGSLYLFAAGDLWRSDGTEAGTVLLQRFHVASHQVEPLPVGLTSLGNRLFFVADDGVHGLELWQSDGTAAGTTLVRDIAAGPVGAQPAGLRVAAGRLFFAATDRAHGTELWESDGTEAGTRLVQDLAPGAVSSRPMELTAAGNRLYFSADDGLTGRELWALTLDAPGGCQPSAAHLCLQGNRFQVEALWRDGQGHGHTATAAALTGDTGYFWFFGPDSAEVIVKLLDGRGLNGHFWVFYGALSNVEYVLTVTDTETGLTRRYLNPNGVLASVGDTHGFGPLGAFGAQPPARAAASLPSRTREGSALAAACEPGPTRLCLNAGRFAVAATWKDSNGQTGAGTAVSLTPDTGYFWFFGPDNVEVVLKVLDGRQTNGKFWVFYGALSNLEYTLTVTDSATGKFKTYTNPRGRFASVADTAAF